MPVYLDHNATTHLDPRVVEAMAAVMSGPAANASSLHRYGRIARDAVEQARAQVAALIGCSAREVIFTSGGTEANNLAIRGSCGLSTQPGRLLYGATEHPSVMETAEALRMQGWGVEPIAVDQDGRIATAAYAAQLAGGDVRLVALMGANNETGVIHDLPPLIQAARASGARVHVDAVQVAGRLELDFAALDADTLTLSAHKFHGPKGAGALVLREGLELLPQATGGAQENGWRGGTENVAAIVGFGVAAALARSEREARAEHLQQLRDALVEGLSAMPGVTLFGLAAPRLPNTVQFALPGWDGETLLMALDRKGYAVSSGSACKAGHGAPSHVLIAMGYDRDTAKGAVRVSFGKDNGMADVEALLAALRTLARPLAMGAA